LGGLFFLWSVFLISCGQGTPGSASREIEPHRFQGQVMGTTWSVVIADEVPNPKAAEAAIKEALDRVDQLMSNWKDDSEVCRFNRLPAGETLALSEETAYVIQTAFQIYEETDGRFDPTLGPLIELWGFSRKEKQAFPQDDAIASARSQMGMADIRLENQSIQKSRDGISLNLSAIAKGYGVDAAFESLRALGFMNYLVEVGGEVRVAGSKPGPTPWRVGIETPKYGLSIQRDLFSVAQLKDVAMATSGDYRNYFEYEGKNYSHIIDPGTGYPVASPIASATVIAPNCTLADAFATAFMILSPQRSIEICNANPNLDCLIIERSSSKVFQSDTMNRYLVKP